MVDGLGEKIRSSSEYTGLKEKISTLDDVEMIAQGIRNLDLEEELEARDLKVRESGLL
jgi:hypothetical protein